MQNQKSHISAKIFLLALSFCLVPFHTAAAEDPQTKIRGLEELEQTAENIANDPILVHGEWSVFVMDTKTGEILLALNSDKSLAPASNLKLLTTSAALTYFGPDHRFKTTLGYKGIIENHQLSGDLAIIGGGDPTLGSSQVKGSLDLEPLLDLFVNKIHAAGIQKITGKIVADVSWFDPVTFADAWLWGDIGNYYGAGPSALCVHDNLYYLYFKPGKNVGDPAAILFTKPALPAIHFENYMKTGAVYSGDNGYIYGAAGGNTRILRGTIPAGVKQFAIKGSLSDPPLFFVQILQEKLKQNNIQISGDVHVSNVPVAVSDVIFELDSPSLRDIVYWINKKSINLYTEVLLKHLGKMRFGTGSFENGCKALEQFLTARNVPVDGLHLRDGSGLSPLDAITTRQMGLLLQSMTRDSSFSDFYQSLPIAGSDSDDGGIGHLCRGTFAANNLRAKTGYIDRVRAHSGYVTTRSGRFLCFSMIANDHTGTTSQIDRLHEKLMVQLAETK